MRLTSKSAPGYLHSIVLLRTLSSVIYLFSLSNEVSSIIVIIMERRLRMTNAERSCLHRSRNRFCRTRLKQVMDALYSHFPDAWLFVHKLQSPSQFRVTSPPPRANAGQQPEIRPQPQPRPQPALQPEPPCIDELMDELFGSASPHPCEGELDFELDFFLTIYNIKCK